ncbi:O-methyltransferase [Haloarchaeobius salinus]|uniref:O-methyltransferase n=1 Tax=Haloarchaeobius salinus TaxID=1198298 RepID=UPI00210EA172|nr:O-methyltransferase [Haloarchaeobius salinus]
MDLLSDETARFVRATAPEPDGLAAEMDAYAAEQDFPHVGPGVGGLLRTFARMVDAERVFEFGSGFGYSAYWWGQALPADGELVLTEFDEDELDMAREFLQRGGLDDIARYEHGDALDAVERYDGPFDCVLVDHQKHRYAEAFEAVREKVAPGGVVVADNAMTAGIIEFEKLLAIVEGDDPGEVNEHTRGIADYLETVRSDPEFETNVLPVGEGIAVSYRLG